MPPGSGLSRLSMRRMKQCKVLSRKGFRSLLSQQNSAEPSLSKRERRKMKWFLQKMRLYSEALSGLDDPRGEHLLNLEARVRRLESEMETSRNLAFRPGS